MKWWWWCMIMVTVISLLTRCQALFSDLQTSSSFTDEHAEIYKVKCLPRLNPLGLNPNLWTFSFQHISKLCSSAPPPRKPPHSVQIGDESRWSVTRCSLELAEIIGWVSGTGFATMVLMSNLMMSGAHVWGSLQHSLACLWHTFLSLFDVSIQLEISKMLSEEVDEWHFSAFIDLGLRQAKRRPYVPQGDDESLRGPKGGAMSHVLPSKS